MNTPIPEVDAAIWSFGQHVAQLTVVFEAACAALERGDVAAAKRILTTERERRDAILAADQKDC